MLVKGKKVVNAHRRQASSGERWICGRHSVERRIAVAPDSIIEVAVVPRRGGRPDRLLDAARAAGLAARDVDAATLARQTGTDKHQGVGARLQPFRYQGLAAAVAVAPRPVLAVDRVQDPRNLGAMIRTAVGAGVGAVVLPRHQQVEITASVEKAASGTVNDVAVCRVANLVRALDHLRKGGFWTVGLSPRGGEELFRARIPDPTVLVVGGEHGLAPLVARSCDLLVSIPMDPAVESLNASVAAAIALYDLVRRRS